MCSKHSLERDLLNKNQRIDFHDVVFRWRAACSSKSRLVRCYLRLHLPGLRCGLNEAIQPGYSNPFGGF